MANNKNTIDSNEYQKQYELSISDPENFWGQVAGRLKWSSPWNKVKNVSYHSPVHIKWFEGGKLNVSENCVDRHLALHADKTAIIWEADDINTPSVKWTYKQLHEQVCLMANVLKKHNVRKGDRVTIYMPMIPEAAVAMLACARIGAVHSVIFGGFAPDSIVDRILDCESSFVITADAGFRAGRTVQLKKNMDEALHKIDNMAKSTTASAKVVNNPVQKVLVIKHGNKDVDFHSTRDLWWHEELKTVSANCPAEPMDAEDPLFILYTSGSTGKPKGVLHTTGGYLVYASYTHATVFNLQDNDIYWCTADVGWVTGHSYCVYGPLANAATTLLFEGVPNYPDVSRFWQVIDKHQVSIFYTAPTAIRALMREGDAPVKKYSRQSLRILGSVGEPINPEAWLWYQRVVGDNRCPVIDTWWQTETGGVLISPIPHVTKLKPGSATLPFFGVKPLVVNQEGEKLEGACEGILLLQDSWPGQMRTVYRDHQRFEETYFKAYPGYYFTGDGCRRDEDGYYWITGRVDDVLNVSGHRLGTAEIESALVAHPKVAEAAVVGYPHDIKGQGIYAYVTLNSGVAESEELRKELIQWVAAEISAIAKPDLLQWAHGLPKTRSGKIMRRILRKIAENAPDQLGDISTLADPAVVADLVQHRLNL